MLGDFFRRLLQILAIASLATVFYLNILSVPRGSVVFLQRIAGSASDGELMTYTPGYHFVSTLFVPGRWRRYRLETTLKQQEFRIKLPLRYSAYLRLNDLFYVQLRLRIEGEIDSAQAQDALRALNWLPTERDQFIEESIRLLIADYFVNLKTDERQLEKLKVELTSFLRSSNLAEVQRRLDSQLHIPWYRLKSLELREIYVPDSDMYLAQTRNLGEVAAADRKALLMQIEREAELALERKRNMEELAKAEKMAALIQENPALLEYYKIEKIAPRAGQVILDASGKTPDRRSTILIPNEKERGRDGNENKNEAGGEIGPAQKQR